MSGKSTERIYSLDALRAVMMLLGLLLHTAISYGSHDYGAFWPVKSPENSILFDLIVALIHFFRMPVFFVAAGFFTALLYYTKGPEQMMLNRAKRIFLPFVAGVLLVYPAARFSFEFSAAAFGGSTQACKEAWTLIQTGGFLPFNVLHLWFLYFLMMYAVLGMVLAGLFRKASGLADSMNRIITGILKRRWLRIACLSCLYFGCLYWIGEPSLTTNNSWRIHLPIFFTYFLFFETGWVIYRTNTLSHLAGRPKTQLGLALVLFFVFIFTPWRDGPIWLLVREMLSALFGTLFIFGFIAFFMRYFSRPSALISYLVGASYWVYLVHLPVVVFMPGLMASWAIPLVFKFLCTVLTTGMLCFASYHYLVRNTFVGVFLNGRKAGNPMKQPKKG